MTASATLSAMDMVWPPTPSRLLYSKYRPPVACNVSFEVAENQQAVLCLLNLVSDPDCDYLTIVGVGSAAHGTVQLNCFGQVIYTPAHNYWGADQFTYTVSDGQATSTGTITIKVDSPPVIAPIAITTPAGTGVTLNLLSYATDLDGDKLTLGCINGSCHGSITLNKDGTVTYTPSGHYYGADSFSFTVTDGYLSITGTVQITVTKVNQAPVVCDVTACTGVGQAICLNWHQWTDDADGDKLSLAGISAALHGKVEIHKDGSLWYIPSAGFSGTETLSLGITDGQATTTARVTIKVQNSLLSFLGLGQSISADDNGSTLNVVSTLPAVVNLPCAEDALEALFGSSKAQGNSNVKITLDAPVAPANSAQVTNSWASTFVCGNEQDQIVVLPDFSIKLNIK